MDAQEWTEVFVLIACFLLAGLASGTETALTSVGRLRVRFLAEQGSKSAAILQRLRSDPNRFLSTVLFTNTLALILASTSATLPTGLIGTKLSPSRCITNFPYVYGSVRRTHSPSTR